MDNFKFYNLELPGLVLIEPKAFEDHRGFFMEIFKENIYYDNLGVHFVQDNLSFSKKGVLRGLHFQKRPSAQAKLVQVVHGEIFDVAVDIRKGSPTFGRWVGLILSSKNRLQLFIPEGFAHGFCVLSETATVLYKTSAFYDRECERGIIWNDPEIGIDWPIKDPILSEKDSKLPTLANADIDFYYYEK
uniref:dTDP-4-dehydrorhamnose 3,5-epimerase n=1 Tax=candidate division WOR-3 bacterium TaxID=2052148 RepID=A0A7C2K4C8_UNCW3